MEIGEGGPVATRTEVSRSQDLATAEAAAKRAEVSLAQDLKALVAVARMIERTEAFQHRHYEAEAVEALVIGLVVVCFAKCNLQRQRLIQSWAAEG